VSTVEDKQAEIPDLLAQAKALVAALECAESCESESDFQDNVSEALSLARSMSVDLILLAKDA
jgi:hypothetical protein